MYQGVNIAWVYLQTQGVSCVDWVLFCTSAHKMELYLDLLNYFI